MKIKHCKTFFYSTFVLLLMVLNNLVASGAFDKGSSAGKGIWELSLTLNPFNLISYGQNYGVLSYGLSHSVDIVSYYSKHRDGLQSIYLGGLYQFMRHPRLDLSVAFGSRKIINNNSYDVFFPQLLFNYKLSKNTTIGGSVVNVVGISDQKKINKGSTIDIAFYKKIDYLNKISPKIIDVYFGLGLFKNTSMDLNIDNYYIHYSVDIRFNFDRN